MPKDQELFNQIRTGDRQAFKILFEKYYSGLIGFGQYLLKDRETSRELVQEIFLTLWEKRKVLIIESPKAYLFSAMNNKALNVLRHQKIVRAMENELLSDQQQTYLLTENQPFIREAIQKAIDELPERAKECFILTQVDGLSVREAADQLSITAKTVENHLARSRHLLQKKLKKYRE